MEDKSYPPSRPLHTTSHADPYALAESVLPLEARANPAAKAVAFRCQIFTGRRGALRLGTQVVLVGLELPTPQEDLLELGDVLGEVLHVGEVGLEIADQRVPTTDAGSEGVTVSGHAATPFRLST